MSEGRLLRPIVLATMALLGALALPSTATASHSVTSLVSGGSGANAAFWAGATADGGRVYFDTDEQLVPADTDASLDIYERVGTTLTLVSTGPSGGNGANDAFFDAVSRDGSRVFFDTDEKLVAADTDSFYDVYERSGGTTTLISTGSSGGNGNFDVFFSGISADGTRVFFETDEELVATDGDNDFNDVYERSGGTTSLVSAGGNGDFFASFEGSSEDGTRAFFSTREQLGGDTDTSTDVYERSGGTTTLVSTGSANLPANFAGNSADGSRVFFHTSESLAGGDSDGVQDVYERSGGTTTLVSAGGNALKSATYQGASRDGTRVFFHTGEALSGSDGDGAQDVYERSGGTTTLISTGPAGGNGAIAATYEGASADGTRVFFRTQEALVLGDGDGQMDVYERAGTTTTNLSGGSAAQGAFFDGASSDGTRVFFETNESLAGADADGALDVYERSGGTTSLISGGSASTPVLYEGNSEDGGRVWLYTTESLLAADADAAGGDVYESRINDAYVRPQGAVNLRVPLAIAYEQCNLPGNRTHGPALSFPSCNPPVQESDYLTAGTQDANGEGPKLNGSVRWTVLPGTPGGADDTDVRLTMSVTDVRNKTGLGDYAGELSAHADLRITDRFSGSGGSDAATMVEVPFSFVAGCTATGDTTVGSSCDVTTTADTVMPGSAPETKRSIWELSQIRVLDGGADGVASTEPNTTFLRQGVFIP